MSGGVGLTPMISMLNTLVANYPSRQVTFIHAAQNGHMHAMREHVEELARQHSQLSVHWCYEKPTDRDRTQITFHKEGYIDLTWLQNVVPTREAAFYFCGPTPFMKAINGALQTWGVPEADIHYEFFGPAGSL